MANSKRNFVPFIVFIATVNLYIGLRLTIEKNYSGIPADGISTLASFTAQRNSSGGLLSGSINPGGNFSHSAKTQGNASQTMTRKGAGGKDAADTVAVNPNVAVKLVKDQSWGVVPVRKEYLETLSADVLNHPAPQFVQGLRSPCFVLQDEEIHQHVVKLPETNNKKAKTKGKPAPKKTRRLKYLIGDQPNFEGLPSIHARHLRCLPAFYFVGFTKSGTTEFYGHFIQHQHVIAPVFKEPRFWDENRPVTDQKRSIQFITRNYETMAALIESCYLGNDSKLCHGNFQSSQWDLDIRLNLDEIKQDLQTYKSDGRPCPLISVDSSTTYVSNSYMWENDPANKGLVQPAVLPPHRIHHLQPDAKFVILLRDPVSRLYSDFNFFVYGKGKGPQLFHKAVVNGIAWWNQCIKQYSNETCAYAFKLPAANITNVPKGVFGWGISAGEGNNGVGRLRQGLYAIFISKWLEVFPRKQILVIKFEDYSADGIELLKSKVYPFLDMAPLNERGQGKIQDLQRKGHLNKKKSSAKMLPETEKLLKDFYRPYNEKLVALLGDDKFLW